MTSRSDAYISVSDKWSNFREGFTEGMIVTIYGKVQRISPTEIRVQYSGTDDAPYIFTTLAPEGNQNIFRQCHIVINAIFTFRIVSCPTSRNFKAPIILPPLLRCRGANIWENCLERSSKISRICEET